MAAAKKIKTLQIEQSSELVIWGILSQKASHSLAGTISKLCNSQLKHINTTSIQAYIICNDDSYMILIKNSGIDFLSEIQIDYLLIEKQNSNNIINQNFIKQLKEKKAILGAYSLTLSAKTNKNLVNLLHDIK